MVLTLPFNSASWKGFIRNIRICEDFNISSKTLALNSSFRYLDGKKVFKSSRPVKILSGRPITEVFILKLSFRSMNAFQTNLKPAELKITGERYFS